MSKGNESWGRFAAKAAMLGAVVLVAAFVGVRLANAGPGEPVRKALTVSGTLTGPMVGSTTTATFRFYRALMGGEALCSPVVSIRDGMERNPTTGAFSVDVSLEQDDVAGEPRRKCPDTLFHDPNAYVEVVIGGTSVVPRRPINPVPYAVYAQQYGTPDCPVGYERMTEDVPMGKWFCRGRGGDDVVRVGDGASAFWIDRYEATVWTGRDGLLPGMTGVTRFNSPGDFDAVAFPPNGQWRSGWTNTPPPMFALSVGGGRFTPARYITWFQAQEACRASGKRLPTGEEWLTAAQGTPDPGENNGRLPGNNRCHTIGDDVRTGTSGAGCRSAWGAEDMIGNVMEWTAEWYAGLTTVDVVSPSGSTPTDGWPVETNAYNGDGTWGIASSAYANQSGRRVGVPAAGVRGGQWGAGFRAGVFHVRLDYAPSMSNANLGFRCVIPR